jgi:hypothetical protein
LHGAVQLRASGATARGLLAPRASARTGIPRRTHTSQMGRSHLLLVAALAACVATVSGAGHARPPFACSAPCTVRTWGFAREPDCPNPKPPKKQCLQSALWSPPPVASFPPDCVVALSGPARGPFGIRRARRVPPRSLAPFSFPSCCFHNPAAADSNWGAKILSSDAASALTGRHIQVWHVSLHRWQVYRCQGSQRNGPRHSRGCRVP